MTGVGRDGTANEVQNVEVDATEMEVFWKPLEAFSHIVLRVSDLFVDGDCSGRHYHHYYRRQCGARRGRR
jgi:hypothetical protein